MWANKARMYLQLWGILSIYHPVIRPNKDCNEWILVYSLYCKVVCQYVADSKVIKYCTHAARSTKAICFTWSRVEKMSISHCVRVSEYTATKKCLIEIIFSPSVWYLFFWKVILDSQPFYNKFTFKWDRIKRYTLLLIAYDALIQEKQFEIKGCIIHAMLKVLPS